MAVTKRGNGYQVDFVVNGQRYRPPVFATEEEAETWEFTARQAIKRGKAVEMPKKAPEAAAQGTIEQALTEAKNKRWAYKRGSHRTVLNAENFVKWVGPKEKASVALSLDKIHEFVGYLKDERKVGGSTINKYLSAISVLIEFAKVARPELPYQEKGQNRTRFFTEEEVDLVNQTLSLWGKHRERDLFIFLVDTGARPYSEATTLRWEMVGDRRVEFVMTKNATNRTLPLTTRAWEAVQRQREHNGDGPWTDITEWQMIDLWRSIRVHLPQLKDTVVYTARHTCASWQVIRGVDLMRVMKWMGHKSYQTTLNYAHLAPDHLLDNVTVLEGGASPKLMIINGSHTE
ncbi:tyrosine-type recombinase/integrase [Ensifer aridi]|uniref:tyrosine-type recombinase/integrase n=1 Tax=Ensifer aridi TaxID=1708715 RepID=UPI000A0FC095|nr:site-specific integrase [Ensifer aridi]